MLCAARKRNAYNIANSIRLRKFYQTWTILNLICKYLHTFQPTSAMALFEINFISNKFKRSRHMALCEICISTTLNSVFTTFCVYFIGQFYFNWYFLLHYDERWWYPDCLWQTVFMKFLPLQSWPLIFRGIYYCGKLPL